MQSRHPHKEIERKILQADIKRYLNGGGKIQAIASGYMAYDRQPFSQIIWRSKHDEAKDFI